MAVFSQTVRERRFSSGLLRITYGEGVARARASSLASQPLLPPEIAAGSRDYRLGQGL